MATSSTLPSTASGPDLQHWPVQAAARLRALIAANAHQGAYAVFDADNTSYHHDLVGSLLPFMEARGDRHPTDLAGLRGARFVASIETEQGRRWNESKVKAITGGDKVSARFMRQDFFEDIPQFKLVIAGNHKPSIRNVDEAMKRRLHLIPFTVTVPPEKRDGQLTERLLAERDGILAWAVDGCLAWQRDGLRPPACVVSATEEYFEAEDALGQWIEARCLLSKRHREGVSELFTDWREWAERAGEYVGSVKRFAELMATRKFDKCRLTGGARALAGISLRPKPYGGGYPYRDD